MIKRNESDVGDIGFEILAKTRVPFPLFYIVFSIDEFFMTLQPSNCNGVYIKMKHSEVMRKWFKKMGIEIFDK